MTPDTIRTLPDSRDTDVMVARAMCNRHGKHLDGLPLSILCQFCAHPKPYTADTPEGWAAMRECVEWLRSKGKTFRFAYRSGWWECGTDEADLFTVHPSLPHAVGLLVLMVIDRDAVANPLLAGLEPTPTAPPTPSPATEPMPRTSCPVSASKTGTGTAACNDDASPSAP